MQFRPATANSENQYPPNLMTLKYLMKKKMKKIFRNFLNFEPWNHKKTLEIPKYLLNEECKQGAKHVISFYTM